MFLIGVIIGIWLAGVHHPFEHIPEIGRKTGVVVLRGIIQHDGQRLERICLLPGYEFVFSHLGQDVIASEQGRLVIQNGIVPRGLIDHSHKGSRLFYGKLGRVLVKKGGSSRPDSIGIAPIEDRIQVHGQQFFLSVIAFQLDSRDPLFHLDHQHLKGSSARNIVYCGVPRIQRLCHLLGECAASAGTALP